MVTLEFPETFSFFNPYVGNSRSPPMDFHQLHFTHCYCNLDGLFKKISLPAWGHILFTKLKFQNPLDILFLKIANPLDIQSTLDKWNLQGTEKMVPLIECSTYPGFHLSRADCTISPTWGYRQFQERTVN